MQPIGTLSSRWRRLLAANSTSSSFGTLIETVTEPVESTTSGVIEMAPSGSAGPNGLVAMFFGAGSNDQTFSVQVWGWESSLLAGIDVWNCVLLAQFACTLGNIAGAAGGEVTASGLVVDTIALTYGNDDISVDITSPENNLQAHVVMDTKGFSKVQFQFDMTGATSGNALVRKL